MSYSRWSNSYWYTYWGNNHDDNRFKNLLNQTCKGRQLFAVCGVSDFTYSELKKDIFACANKCSDLSKGNTPEPTDKEVFELVYYMLCFMKDVDFDFSFRGLLLNWGFKKIWRRLK